jgi:hypothetical protein
MSSSSLLLVAISVLVSVDMFPAAVKVSEAGPGIAVRLRLTPATRLEGVPQAGPMVRVEEPEDDGWDLMPEVQLSAVAKKQEKAVLVRREGIPSALFLAFQSAGQLDNAQRAAQAERLKELEIIKAFCENLGASMDKIELRADGGSIEWWQGPQSAQDLARLPRLAVGRIDKVHGVQRLCRGGTVEMVLFSTNLGNIEVYPPASRKHPNGKLRVRENNEKNNR